MNVMARKNDTDSRDGGWAWVVAIACFVTNFISVGFLRSGSVLYVSFTQILGLSRVQSAWPLSLMASVMHLSGPIFSCLIQYLTIRKLVMIGSVLSASGCILCYFSLHFISLILFLGIVNGLGNGLIYTFNPVIINMHFNKYKTTAMGIFRGGASVGSFVLPPLLEILITNYGLKGCFLLLGGVLMQGIAAACLYRQPKSVEESQKTVDDKENKWKTLRTAAEVGKDPIFLIISISFAIFFLFINIYGTVIVDFAVDREVSTTSSVFLVSAYALSDMCGRFGSGWIVDLGIMKRVNVVVLCFLSMGCLLCVLPQLWSYTVMMVLSSILGFLSGCTIIQESVFLSEYLGINKLPAAVGLSNFITGLVVLLVQAPITGHFREKIGRYDYLFYLLASLLFACAFLWILEPLIQRIRDKNLQCDTKFSSSFRVVQWRAVIGSDGCAASLKYSVMENKIIDERDRGWAWVVVGAALFTGITSGGFTKTKGVFYVHFTSTLGLDRVQSAWPLSLIQALMNLSGPIFSYLMQYLSIRILVISGTIFTALGCTLCYFSSHFISLIIFLGIINGIGNGAIYNLSWIIVDMNFKKYKTTAMGIFKTGATIGGFVLPLLTEYLISVYGLKGSFLLLGGVLLHGTVAACLYRQPRILEIQKGEKEQVENVKNEWKTLKTAIEIAKDPIFLIVSFTFAILRLFFNVFETVIVRFGVERGISMNFCVFLSSAYSIADMFGRLGSGWLVDFGFVKRINAVIIYFTSLAILLCILPHLWNYSCLMVVTSLIGFVGGCVMIHQVILLSEYLGVKKLPTAVGLNSFLIGLSQLIFAAPISGYFRDYFGSYDYLFYFLASLFFVSALLWTMEPLVQRLRKRNDIDNRNEQN
ncbi:uncharacterized protein LOC111631046 [Centruroides sculpturatus]|uniref:uncharacterized protein LOC111631046 n=1 Tax=Centruroides sculpturatus TaxID=218467 RepID=UPI000C6D5A15|nr:uncharacterized protein LOC111631046 [Centruroides sculpturatus]